MAERGIIKEEDREIYQFGIRNGFIILLDIATAFRTEEMLAILSGRGEQTEFDEELYRKLVTKIVVYKDGTAEVIFLNGSRIKTGYR